MMTEITGYPSIDKPWLRFYPQKNIGMKISQCNMYDYIRERNVEYLSNNAIEFFGNHISYKRLFDNIDDLGKAFWANGIRKGDVVSFIAITSPEIIYSIYALNRIGAVCNILDPRMNDETIISKLNITKSKHLILLDIFEEKAKVVSRIEDMTIYLLDFSLSMPSVEKAVYKMKKQISFIKTCVQWKTLLHDGKDAKPEYQNTTEDAPALIVYTGGTTGEPKGVVLSNQNVNVVAYQYERSGTEIKREHTWQTVAAPFITYTLVYSTHMPLSYGMECKIVIYDPQKIAVQTVKNKYNHVAGNPLMWESVIRSSFAQDVDFSHLIDPTTGADYMSPQLEREINEFLATRGCKWKMCQGYGLTEVASAVCKNLSNDVNKLGSVGIPFIDMIVSSFEVDSDKELTYGEKGEICISGPSVMLGYYNDKDATDEMIKTHSDGKVWLHSGDLGHIDKDGFVYIDGRIKRMFVSYNGAKIFPPFIEKVIMQNKMVQRCCVVGIKDPNNMSGKVPYAFIILKKEYKNKKAEARGLIIESCMDQLPEYEIPVDLRFIDSVPVTAANKVNYIVLEEQASAFINDR